MGDNQVWVDFFLAISQTKYTKKRPIDGAFFWDRKSGKPPALA
jgi:hypothetical protein